MYKVIIVDDEPAARRHIRLALKKKCENLKVVGEFENGKEAWMEIQKNQPDIVITDVKMPAMDGIELATKIQQHYPSVITLLVSGYSEFDYARRAIKSGVKDYFLKPVAPSDIQVTMQRIEKILDAEAFRNRKRIMHKIAQGAEIESEKIARYFPQQSYHGCLVRRNGIPRRFFATTDMEIVSDNHEIFFVYGRDEMEELYLYPETLNIAQGCKGFAEKIFYTRKNDTNYVTAIYSEKPFQIADFKSKIKSFYQILESKSTIGKDQILALEEIEKTTEKEHQQEENNLERIKYYLSQRRYAEAKNEIDKNFKKYERGGCTQLEVEMKARQIFWMTLPYIQKDDTIQNRETVLDDIFLSALNLNEVKESIYTELFQNGDEKLSYKANSKEFFDNIIQYIDENLAEPLSLQTLCKEMGISQTHLSKQFRKNTKMSFGNYLTKIRMEKAKQLLREVPDIYICDVASLVGYNDQFYFSKVFHSYVGVSPSSYSENVESKEN